jgi:DNA-directed RNA polymerase subunit H (RpoH/RPB5)
MSVVTKICNSIHNLKKYLHNDWDVSVIPELSVTEIDALYGQSVPQTPGMPSFGLCSACNLTLCHRELPSHKLHVIFYNFGEKNSTPPKVTKTCGGKIQSLYNNEIISRDDSLIIIFQCPVTENISKTIEDIYIDGQEKLKIDNLSDEVLHENESIDEPYRITHFRNIHAFYLDHLSVDITTHHSVPPHEPIRKEAEIQQILNTCNATLDQLPRIMRNDAQAKCLRLAPGDICKINRISSVGETTSYRVCV